ncbi:hypothetical protein K457DRAFT_1873001 [Linnemannia elongata AG-77]|uniref:Uncharacterized protein n=1 Tax=Linnemannia elongata AG-77 TaxID=1314771 RepID=A0A197K4R3_9FUNG|nr:hypothetical protein K457DRAFT_1873001 [Linnemannia elongata AG-77]
MCAEDHSRTPILGSHPGIYKTSSVAVILHKPAHRHSKLPSVRQLHRVLGCSSWRREESNDTNYSSDGMNDKEVLDDGSHDGLRMLQAVPPSKPSKPRSGPTEVLTPALSLTTTYSPPPASQIIAPFLKKTPHARAVDIRLLLLLLLLHRTPIPTRMFPSLVFLSALNCVGHSLRDMVEIVRSMTKPIKELFGKAGMRLGRIKWN